MASSATFGLVSPEALPHELSAQANEVLRAGGAPAPLAASGYLQSPYGVVQALNGGPLLAWLVQGAATTALAAPVWWVWRSPFMYPLQAAILSLATLMATPYVFAHDMAAIAAPAGFLAREQAQSGVLTDEASVAIAVFPASIAALAIFWDWPGTTTFGAISVGPISAIILLVMIVRRIGGVRPARGSA
jgi:arabinofuranan 3-O-arabinosyltransferase